MKKPTLTAILLRLLPVLIGICEDIHEARQKTSAGGRKITREEAREIARNAWDTLCPEIVGVLLDEDA